MNNKQTNFEALKSAFYNQFTGGHKAGFAILTESLKGHLLPHFNTRAKAFDEEFNKWLDLLDIRQAGVIIDILIENGANLPGWMKSKRYFIDYNQHGFLDLQKITTE